jgi:hypothetical protein
MKKYAQIDSNGIVVGVSDFGAEVSHPNLIPIDSVADVMGMQWNGSVFVAVPPVPAPPAPRHITVGAFFDRFGAHKWPILADQNPLVQALIKDCSVRKHINLDDPQLPAGLALLVESGHVIDVQNIITAPVQSDEKP